MESNIHPSHLSRNRKYIVSPLVHGDRRVTFRFQAPEAKDVKINGLSSSAAGRFLEPARPMEKNQDGVWQITVGPLKPEIYRYNFVLDGIEVLDPNNPEIALGERPSCSLVSIPGDAPKFYDEQDRPHGSVSIRWYMSKSLGVTKRMLVYTPPEYDHDNRREYPILFLLHGTHSNEYAWTSEGRADFIFDNLIAEGRAEPLVIVMPYCRAYPVVSKESGSLGYIENIEAFQRDLFTDIFPYVNREYRVCDDPENRAIVGLSGGGGLALSIGLNHLDRFGWVCAFSSAIREDEFETNYGEALGDADQVNARLKLLWVGCGDKDHLYQANIRFIEWLRMKGIRHLSHITGGGHDFQNWREYLYEIAPLLFR